MSRGVLVLLHRWAGLAMALFLVIVGLTGSLLAFARELDALLAPGLLTVERCRSVPLDPLELLETARMLHPEMRPAIVQLHIDPTRTVEFIVPMGEARSRAVYLDPCTGVEVGARDRGEAPLAALLTKEQIISFIARLHMTLALPGDLAPVGAHVLGVVALVWTIDCFVSFVLTLPHARRASKSWLRRWRIAWRIEPRANAFRLNFDIHRAFGLWTWVILLVFAWSSVGFNLREAYQPVMSFFFEMRSPLALASREEPLETPALDWRMARARGRELLAGLPTPKIESEQYLMLLREHGVYVMLVRSVEDVRPRGQTFVAFDADTGELKTWSRPGGSGSGQVLADWLAYLHMADVFGLPMRIFVCAMGLVVTSLSVTGVYIWWKKKHAARIVLSRARRGADRRAARTTSTVARPTGEANK